MTRVLGIDPGLANCGWALVDTAHRKPFCVESGVWVTDPSPDTAGRISAIGSLFGNLARCVRPELIAIEAWTYQRHDRSNSVNTTTIPRVIERLRTLADLRGLPVIEVHQQAAKSALGVRKKEDVKRAVAILIDGSKVSNGHAADAVAVAIAGERRWRAQRNARPDIAVSDQARTPNDRSRTNRGATCSMRTR